MNTIKIRISNEKLWEYAMQGEDIDAWLKDNVGVGNWSEWHGITALPYRSFSFKSDKDLLLFTMRWA